MGNSRDYDLLPLKFWAHRKDGDLGSWEIWVNREIGGGHSVILMIGVVRRQRRGTALLSHLVTDKFVLP